jgi:hypothetical protein
MCKNYEKSLFHDEFKLFYPKSKKDNLTRSFCKDMVSRLGVDKFKIQKGSFTQTGGVAALK